MDPVTMVSILSAVAAAVWTAWTWSEEHRLQRQIKRDQTAALYVNPFLLVIDEVERRLDGVLHGEDLSLYKKEHPGRQELGSLPAVATVYVLGEMFGWAYMNMRYGPYTRDPKMIEITAAIARTFSRRGGFPDDAFRFSMEEQNSLGQAVVRRLGEADSALPEFASVTLFEFEQDFRDPQSKRVRLFRSDGIRRAIEAIDRADRPEKIEGRERLAAVHRLVRRLIEHFERIEGFSLSAPSEAIHGEEAVASSPTHPAAPDILHRMRGRIRLRIPRLREDEAYAQHLMSLVGALSDVDDVGVNSAAASITVRYRRSVPDAEFQVRLIEAITADELREARAARLESRAGAANTRRVPGPVPARRRRSRAREGALQ